MRSRYAIIAALWLLLTTTACPVRGPYSKMPARQSASWVRDAVIYEVYLRSFSPDGTFKSLQARLPELKELGVTVLWLMPIHPVGQKNRKGSLGSLYSIKDYYGINPEFGTLEDFKNLVAAVHAAGMKIIIDLVANHTAWDNELVQKHPDWYTRDATGHVIAPVPDWSDVADLNYDHHEPRQYMLDVMTHWVRDIGIDGYRCDVAEMVPLDFWEPARAELDKIKPVLMLAEGSDPALHVKAFDLTYAWNVYKALVNIFQENGPARLVREALRNEELNFPQGSLRLRFTDNHDENAWRAPAIELFGPQGAKAAAVLTYCLPGVPLLYNGQEVGNPTRLPLFEKVPINWQSDPHGLRDFYRTLLRLRRETPALLEGSLKLVETGSDESALVFYRQKDSERVLVAVNLKASQQQIRGRESPTQVEKRFGDGSYQAGQLTLPGYGWFIGKVR